MKTNMFANQETYHFFVWVTESGMVDVPTLVAQAMETVKKYPASSRSEMSLSELYKGELGMLLSEKVDDVLFEEFSATAEMLGNPGEVYDSGDSLIRPMLLFSLSRISYEAVAEAILKQQRKWAPKSKKPLKKKPVKK